VFLVLVIAAGPLAGQVDLPKPSDSRTQGEYDDKERNKEWLDARDDSSKICASIVYILVAR
jgi:hypothetical protein